MKKIFILGFLLFLTISCNENREYNSEKQNKFEITLYNAYTKDVWTSLGISDIDSIDWQTQKYYFKRDSLLKVIRFTISSYAQFIFLYDSVEIYRASLVSQYRAVSPPKNLPIIFVEKEKGGEAFPNGEFQVEYMEKAKINKRAYKKAEKYLEKRGLLVD